MALNAPAWLLANAFTKDTADEFGAVKGAPCTVGSVTFDADGNTVVELVWTNNAGVSRTTEMKVNAGVGVKSAAIDASGHLILTRTDDTTLDAGEVPLPDMSTYAKKTDIPTKVEDLSDAADYAKKSEIPEGSVVDEDLSETSKNPVQNKTVTAEIKKKVDAVAGKGLSTNDYDDDAVAEVAKIKDKVDTETGKSLVSDTDIAQITANKDAIDILNGDDTTEGSVSKQLKDALGDITEFDIKVVATLPATGEKGIFYFVPKEGGTDPDVHDEYVWVGTKFELIGNTKVDLSDYIAKTDIAAEFGDTPSDEKIPSEKLVKDTLDTKADSTIVTGHTNLDVGSDFNTLVEYGTYRTTTKRVDRIDNLPIKVAGMLEVRLTGGVIYQTYKTIDDEMYIRSSEDTGATWADWKKLSTGADGLEIVDKTQAEYDALSEAEKNDPTKLYNITDAEVVDLTKYATKEYVDTNAEEKYSTDEIKIGTWIDGKPLYRRVFTNVSHQQHILLGQNKFRPVRVEIYNAPSEGLCPMAYNDMSTTNTYSAYLWQDTTGWRVDSAGYTAGLLVIVEYTKTTD